METIMIIGIIVALIFTEIIYFRFFSNKVDNKLEFIFCKSVSIFLGVYSTLIIYGIGKGIKALYENNYLFNTLGIITFIVGFYGINYYITKNKNESKKKKK